MKRNTKIALLIAVVFFLFTTFAFVMANKQFEKSGQSIKMGIEFRSDQVEQLKKSNEKIIEELKATNKDLIQASVVNHKIQEKADSALQQKDSIIYHQHTKLKKKDEKIDSLAALLERFRQSDI